MLLKIRYSAVFKRSGKLNSRGEGLVEIEFRQKSQRRYVTTGVYAKPEEWSKGCFVNSKLADGLNFYIYNMIHSIEEIELEFIKNGTDVTPAILREAYLNRATPSAKITEFGTEFLKQCDKKEATKANYLTLLNNLEKFRKNTTLTDIDYQYLTNYEKWLRESGVSHNTKVSRLRMLRSLLNEAKRCGVIQTNPFNNFKIQSMVSKKGYVTEDKLQKIEEMELNDKEEVVRDSFLIGCYTGLRFSDITTLRNGDIKDGWLKKKMQKTSLTVDIPISELYDGKMMKLIEKYGNNIDRLIKRIPANAVTNKILKTIFRKADVDTTLTFHSSRHTFATLLVQKGLPITTIQKLVGHTKLTTTQIYSEVDRATISNDVKKLKISHQ